MRTFPRRSLLPLALLGLFFSLPFTRSTLFAADTLSEPQRLAALAKVWGLLKYYHPDVAGGTTDWDQALVDAIPRVQAPQSRDDLNRELMTFAQTAGTTVPAAVVPGALLPSEVFGWLDDRTVINPDVGAHLLLIAGGNQPAPANRYVRSVQNWVDSWSPPSDANPDFSGDTAGYDGPAYPDAPHRLLALFRYWNMVHYFYPNRDLLDRNWETVLEEFVPRMLQAADGTAYHLALRELIANITDTHGITGSSLSSAYFGYYAVPVYTRLIEGQTVIVKVFQRLVSSGADLRVGDVITAIDGTPAAAARDRLKKYVNGSNPDAVARVVDNLLLFSQTNAPRSLVVTHDGGASATVSIVPAIYADYYAESNASLNTTAYRALAGGEVGYIDMGVLQTSNAAAALSEFKNTAALIIDLRRYPNGTIGSLMAGLEPAPRPIAKFKVPDVSHPGSFKWSTNAVYGPTGTNPNYYKGRVAVLVDENTQSQGEYTAMALRSGPATTIIGSRTSGADGNVSLIRLPGGFYTYFSGLSVFYPDGTPTQRVGIVPDIEIRPTIKGIRQGRDELVEAALAVVLSAARPQPGTRAPGSSAGGARSIEAGEVEQHGRKRRVVEVGLA